MVLPHYSCPLQKYRTKAFVRCTVANGPSDFQRAINHIYFFRSQDAMSNTRQMYLYLKER